ncbi:MAG: hypothetical protein ACXVAA_01975 [Candidatus Binataceae bacterium]
MPPGEIGERRPDVVGKHYQRDALAAVLRVIGIGAEKRCAMDQPSNVLVARHGRGDDQVKAARRPGYASEHRFEALHGTPVRVGETFRVR